MSRQCGRHLAHSFCRWNGNHGRRLLLSPSRRWQSSSPPSSRDSAVSHDDWQWVPSLFGRLLTAFGMVHIVSEYGVELTLCEGPSMLPTIRPQGEIILVDRLTPRIYGIEGGYDGKERVRQGRERQNEYEEEHEEYSWHQVVTPANQFPPHGKWRRFWTRLTTPISIGDVVVVQHPERHGTVCKRVLGLPGDVVLRTQPQPSRRRRRLSRRTTERKNLYVIPDGHVWIEGDNSLNSSDSRGYGAVPAALIVGRVLCRVWPLRGHCLMERGARPTVPPGRPCTGSTILPAGYEGEEVLRSYEDDNTASSY